MRKRSFLAKLVTAVVTAAMVFSAFPAISVAAEETTDTFAEKISSEYKNVEMKYRPYARWWLAEGSHTDETLKESVDELYNYGFGGVEIVTLDESQYLDDATYAWGSDAWVHDTKVVIERCHELGMSVSVTSGTHWSTANLITITPDQEEAAQELGYTVTRAQAGTFKGDLPKCKLPSEAVTKQTFVEAVAAKVVSEASGDAKETLDLDSMKVVEATDSDGDGTYSVDFSSGDGADYEIFAFYQYGTGESYKPAISPAYTINYLSKKGANALIKYWDENVLTSDLKELFSDMDEVDMYMDSLELNCKGENTTGLLWSQTMLDDFKNYRGYDFSSYIPAVILSSATAGSFGSPLDYQYAVEDADLKKAESIRKDFFQTMTDLYQDNCLDVLSSWLHQNNMKLRAEPSYGRTFEISQPVKSLDYVETESLEFGNELDSYRGLAGAAHVYGKRYSSETGAEAFSNYVRNSNYYRQMIYLQFASGIQKTVTHGYSAAYGPEQHTSWPGYEGMWEMFSARFNKRQPASLDYQAVWAQIGRIQKTLEQGSHQMDIAMLRTDYAVNNGIFISDNYENSTHKHTGRYWSDMSLQNAGYTYDYFSPYLLEDYSTDSTAKKNIDLYQAIIVMEDELPYDAAVQLLNLAKNGKPVVFVNNVTETVANNTEKVNTIAGSTTGSNDGKDADLAKVVAQIKALSNVKTVDSEADAMGALQTLGVYPRAAFEKSNDKILTTLRSTNEADYLYVYNYMYQDTDDWTGTISLDGNFEPYEMDTWTGEAQRFLEYSQQSGRTSLDLTVEPGEVRVFVLKKNSDDVHVTSSKNVRKVVEENGKYYALVENSGQTSVQLSNGASIDSKLTAPKNIDLDGWSLTIDSWEPGEKITRTGTGSNTDISTEVTYATNHVTKKVGTLDPLVTWKNISSLQNADQICGAGTYTNKFTLPADWDVKKEGVIFKAESINGGTVSVKVNNTEVPVNMQTREADLTDYVHAGNNTIAVRVTSSLRNQMIVQKYSGWGDRTITPDDYGMTGATTLITYKKIEVKSNLFKDVQDSTSPYYDSIYWARDCGITTGYNKDYFGPFDNVSRGQMITFVYRYYKYKAAEGSEKYNTDKKYSAAPFKDVKSGEYFTDAVNWAYANHITTGYDADRFGPYNPVTRAEMVTFLYRASTVFGNTNAGSISTDSGFKDVPENIYFSKPVSWAVANKVTTGYGNGKFGPFDKCQRGQGVTFLNRADDAELLTK